MINKLQELVDSYEWSYTKSYYQDEALFSDKVLKPLGYTKIDWFSVERDSFGPLVRGVTAINKDSQEEKATYG